MDHQAKSFTVSFTGNQRVLITECGVSSPFDPLNVNGNPQPPIHRFKGLWDTGASGTVISSEVAQKLGLKPIGKNKVFHAQGESIVNVYAINLYLPNQVGFPFIQVTEGVLNGFDLLIGMDIITTGDFSITNLGGNTTFSFRVPSIANVDFVKQGS